jgi:tRNA(Ile)-lysidine synthase
MSADSPILLGYSGGGDSTFLLRKFRAEGRAVIAAIVDHGLREGSASDAVRAADIAREAGAEAHVLTLSWPDGPKSAQAHARRARLAALAEFARARGISELALAHTLDDQAETVLIRLAAGSSQRGLAAMAARAPLPVWPEGRGVTVNRPLLNARRADLRAALAAEGATWIDDPANELERYARVRVRAQLAAWEDTELAAPRWAALADRFAPLAAELDQAARACIEACGRFNDGVARIERARFAAFAEETQVRALSVLLTAVSGAEREPPEDAVRRLLPTLAGAQGATLGGARARVSGREVEITRDPGALTGRAGLAGLAPLALPAGAAVVWDGRLALKARELGWSAHADLPRTPPALARGNIRLTMSEAVDAGFLTANWLFSERIAHLLWR